MAEFDKRFLASLALLIAHNKTPWNSASRQMVALIS